jgi:hypothetical protein
LVTSKLNYVVFFYIFLTLALAGVSIYFADNKGSITALIPPMLFALMLFRILYRIQRLTIEPNQLRIFQKFTRRSLPRSDIRSIRLRDSEGRFTGGISIETIGGESIDLGGSKSFDQGGIWRNEFELKQAMAKQYAEFIDPPAELMGQTVGTGDEPVKPQNYRGNVLLSVNGISALGFAILLVWENIKLASPGSLSPWWGFLLVSLPPVAMIIFMTNWLFYFRITGDNLEIRNHIIPWYKKEYSFAEINSVVIVRALGRGSRNLGINTKDLKTHRYSAGSLRTEHWHALAKALKQRHIPTKSEF